MLWQGRMNQGIKFLLVTVVDAQKKFHNPESSFWVSNNTFFGDRRTQNREIRQFLAFFQVRT